MTLNVCLYNMFPQDVFLQLKAEVNSKFNYLICISKKSYKFLSLVSHLCGLNFEKPYLNGCLRHKSNTCAKFKFLGVRVWAVR